MSDKKTSNKEKLIVIVGATSVGKTKYSIEIAEKMRTEIISGDSMLFYRGFDIGTAKPDMTERRGIIHHMIDTLPPTAEFNAADFQKEAGAIISKLNCEGKIPVLVGGTGLYVKALLEGYKFNSSSKNNDIRERLQKSLEKNGTAYLYSCLRKILPNEAHWIHENDTRRIIRALEVYYTSGEEISDKRSDELIYDAKVLGIDMSRTKLYERINMRVEMMFEQGWIAEVKGLLDSGVPLSCQAMQAIGYKEIARHILDGGKKEALQLLKDKIKQRTRNFAKRQLTWYRKMPYIEWQGAAID